MRADDETKREKEGGGTVTYFEQWRSAVALEAPHLIDDVDEAELDMIRGLWATWSAKYPRNALRSSYYEAKRFVRDLQISTPPDVLHRINAVVGWPAKTVDMLADRTVFDGFILPGGSEDPFELAEVFERNRFDLEFPQALKSAYTHSCAFLTVSRDEAGEVLIAPRSAESTAAIWDDASRELAGLLVVLDFSDAGHPTEFDVYLPHVSMRCTRDERGKWSAWRVPNHFGAVMAEAVTYSPDLRRPFGRSRISRPVMAITDNAMRTIVRSEVSAEFYTAPRMAAVGVAEDAFARGKWQLAMDRWVGFSKDEDGDVPSLQQFSQMTMQPLLDQYRQYASQFAAETDLPLYTLGIVQDNPSSAEAMRTAEAPLTNRARSVNRSHAAMLRRLAWKVLAVRDGSASLPDEARLIQARFANPEFISPVASADALSKLVAVFPWMAESEVALEYAGFTRDEVARLIADKERAAGGDVIDRLLAVANGDAA